MNLHRVGKGADWENVSPEKRNIFQKIAARTGGILTPANVITFTGAALVASGLKDMRSGRSLKGVVKMGAGRAVDILDGVVAESTCTKSPLGEALDVVTDKLEMAAAVPLLHGSEVLPRTAAGLLIAPNLGNTIVSLYAKSHGREIHSGYEGKLTTLAQWATLIGCFGAAAIARDYGKDEISAELETAGSIAAAAVTLAGAKTLMGYIDQARA